jgi:O-methyltransferase involved in polyketide biosynthesis
MTEMTPCGVDASTPNVARIYDYLLGGKDNFASDRAAAKAFLAAIPDIAAIAGDNRAFVGRAVRYLAEEVGIRQFLDLGGGLPTRSNVHELAPRAHVVYVDYDPVVVKHGEALLASGDRVAMVLGDLTRPDEVLSHPDVLRVLDLSQPVAMLCTATLHFISDEQDPYGVLARYRDSVASGSFLTITHAPSGVPGEDPDDDEANATNVYRQASAQLHVRSAEEIERLFTGFDLVDPGLVWISQWRPIPGAGPLGRLRSLWAGVGRKP